MYILHSDIRLEHWYRHYASFNWSINSLENDGDGPDLLKNDYATADIALVHYDLLPYKIPLVEAVKTCCTALVHVSMDFSADPWLSPNSSRELINEIDRGQRRPLIRAVSAGHTDIARCFLGEDDMCAEELAPVNLSQVLSPLTIAILGQDCFGLHDPASRKPIVEVMSKARAWMRTRTRNVRFSTSPEKRTDHTRCLNYCLNMVQNLDAGETPETGRHQK